MDVFVFRRGDLVFAIRPEYVERFEGEGSVEQRALVTTTGLRLPFDNARFVHCEPSDFRATPRLCGRVLERAGVEELILLDGEILPVIAPAAMHLELLSAVEGTSVSSGE